MFAEDFPESLDEVQIMTGLKQRFTGSVTNIHAVRLTPGFVLSEVLQEKI